MRTNLKSIGAILFVTTFLVGGFFINTLKTEAATTVKSFGVSYSLSPIINTTNSDGSLTTRILVGCAPTSGDLYDVNTGRPCNNIKTVLVGCKAGSGDIFDINTGIRCASYIKPVLVGCGINGGDAYDINTGNKCTNKVIIATLSKPTNTIAKITPISSSITPKLTSNTTKTTVTDKVLGISPLEENTNDLSGRETLKNTITASVEKAGSILTGPMSVSIILLIILILLGGGYGVYSFRKKDKVVETITTKTVTQTPVNKPTPQMPNTNMPISQNPNPQISHINTSQTTTPVK